MSASSSAAPSSSVEDMAASLKKELRRRIGATLKALPDAEVTEQSCLLTEKICALPEFAGARGISVYLEMPKEAATPKLLEAAFAADKKVFVPKITGRSAEDLKMLQATSMNDIRSFPKDKWQIPDPPLLFDTGAPRDDAVQGDDLELVLLPGVAFDRRGGRLGHGKGYYDSFLRRLTEHYNAIGHPPPTTIGLCLSLQLVDQVPLAAHDKMLDLVVTPTEVILNMMGKRVFLGALCLLLCTAVALGQDLYELLGVSSSATASQMKRAYRKLSLKYHPDKQAEENREAMKEEFVKITNAYRVLSDPERREKYDVYGIADDQGFENFDEAARFAEDGVEDSLMNWVGLVAVLAVGIIPIVVMQRNRTKPLKKRREALRSLAKTRLTKAGDKSFTKTFTKTRKQYVDDPTRARTLTGVLVGDALLDADSLALLLLIACRSL
ncbi:hypothetical protein JG687_00004706 [Phytophthora cactorum]|uniref:5-formyltetrahydrofolate cyclo-ligase n=1 Tax=Phytophthora cactorum TaxID=29920 RepID=A0A8T1UMX2_9STRA|nr:hypothetical protein JG687_00004706 [Phytophthora cactorum]